METDAGDCENLEKKNNQIDKGLKRCLPGDLVDLKFDAVSN